MEVKENQEVEYISQWPPTESPSPDRAEDAYFAMYPCKRAKTGLSSKERALSECHPLQSANVLLAKWWKLMKGNLDDGAVISTNPNTQLHYIASLPQAQEFLQSRYKYLQNEVNKNPSCGTFLALSSCCQKLGQYLEGVAYCQMALKECPEDREARWLLCLMQKQADVELRAQLLGESKSISQGSRCLPTPVQIERRDCKGLSSEEFNSLYASNHIPVIITGLEKDITSVPWTLLHIKEVIGDKVAPLKKMVPSSVEWAKLEPAGESCVAVFLDGLDDCKAADMRYLFDWSLPLHCPELMKEVNVPFYFDDNLLQRTPLGTLYRDSWPSLFIAPKGLCSELHVDAFGSNFWMALFEGTKKWLIFPPEDVACLYPVYTHSMDAMFEVHLDRPDLTCHPLLALTHPMECILQPGEVLFVPSGCPHRVQNLDKSLAISANFVNSSNFDRVLAELKINALIDERAEGLLNILEQMKS